MSHFRRTMAIGLFIWGLVLLQCCLFVSTDATEQYPIEYMSKDERESLKEEARDMFYHAYNAYMDNAYPADELMPLSCKGRYRGSEANRGDIDFTLGNYSLTLVDTLDTLVVLGDFEEFENAVKLVIRDVTFDTDVIVSLFETNIRMLGGLLSGHILAEYLQQRADLMSWYRGQLLDLAKDLGYRFLPAFNTTTGVPYGKINLKTGMKGVSMEMSRETCTACAGSMILEMAALSRLTGEPIFEEKAQKAMDVLWKMRHRGTDLMGSVLNVHSGDWVRRDSGVGAGIDSYYEYCLKAYILLGDEKYLGRFNKHYQAVMKYVSQGPMLLDVHMHRPNTNSKNFMDALLAFWPGLQVLKGDIKPAVETHEMLYQVMQRHNFIPEAFTTDFQVHWAHHPLRPEFLESTYFLYKATGDHYYLNVGRKVLRSLQTYAKVPCGYAAVSDVRTNKHDDTMDSFFLSETLKYLFLLFAEPDDLMLNLDEFIFTTEGHLLPLTLSSARTNISTASDKDPIHVNAMDMTCPNSLHLFPATVRMPLRNMVEDVCPSRSLTRRLSAAQFRASNTEHLKILNEMGITILTLTYGRIQLLHTPSNAKSARHSEEGIIFMQEMVEISKLQAKKSRTMRMQKISFKIPGLDREIVLLAGPAHFGLELQESKKVTGKVAQAEPVTACNDLQNPDELKGKIALVMRGECTFVAKARRLQQAGAIAAIVLDNVEGSSVETSPMFAMSGDTVDDADVKILAVFLFNVEAEELISAYKTHKNNLVVTIGVYGPKDVIQLNAPSDISMFERLKGSLKEFLNSQIMPQHPPAKEPTDRQTKDKSDNWIEFENLRCAITKDEEDELLHISAVMPLPANSTLLEWSPDKVEPYKTDLKSWWLFLRQVFISEIYTKTRGALKIKYSELKGLHESVMAHRRMLDGSSSQLVLWLLSELSEVSVSPALLAVSEVIELKKIKRIMTSAVIRPPKRLKHIPDPGNPRDQIENALCGYLVLLDQLMSKFVKHQFQTKSWPDTIDFEQFLLVNTWMFNSRISSLGIYSKLEILENGEFLAFKEIPAEVEKWTRQDFLERCKRLVYFAIKHRLEEKKLRDHELIVMENQSRESTKQQESNKEEGNNLSNASRHIDEL